MRAEHARVLSHAGEGTGIPSDSRPSPTSAGCASGSFTRGPSCQLPGEGPGGRRGNVIARIKAIPGRRWNPAERQWTVPDSPAARQAIEQIRLLDAPPSDSAVASAATAVKPRSVAPAPAVTEPSARAHDDTLRRTGEEMTLRRFSMGTRRAYLHHVRAFLTFAPFPAQQLTDTHVRAYLLERFAHDGVSAAYHSQAVSALRFFFRQVLAHPGALAELPRPRPDQRLPAVLGQHDAHKLVRAASNPKHTAILMLLYSAGLRVSEVVKLRIDDIDAERRTIRVRAAKGRKDRYTILSDRALAALRDYQREYEPTHWLFAGARGNRLLTIRSAQKVVEAACARAGLKRPRQRAYAPSQLRHPPAQARHRQPLHPGTPRPRQPEDHPDLHARQPSRHHPDPQSSRCGGPRCSRLCRQRSGVSGAPFWHAAPLVTRTTADQRPVCALTRTSPYFRRPL